MNKSHELIFDLFIIEYYCSEVAEFVSGKRLDYLEIDEYMYNIYMSTPNIQVVKSCFPVGEITEYGMNYIVRY